MKLIKAGSALLGAELKEEKNVSILISDDGNIKEIFHSNVPSLPSDVEVIDLGGKCVLPGLVDCHAHLALDARIPGHLLMMDDSETKQTIRALKSASDDLKKGITGLRSLGDRYYIDVELRDMERKGDLDLPWMQVAGIGMKGLHGHGYVGKGFSGCEEFRRQARENLFHHTDWLKIFITAGQPPVKGDHVPWFISREEVRTVVSEAKALGVKTSCHCIGGTGLRYCAEEGIDVLDHCYWATEEDIDLIIKHGTTVCFTPGVFMDEERLPMCPPDHAEKVHRTRDEVVRRLSKLVEAKPAFVVGSDAYHGLLWHDLVFMTKLGMAPVDALKGVTVNAARLMGENVGVLEEGRIADIIATDKNPLDDFSTLSSPSFVMHRGKKIVF